MTNEYEQKQQRTGRAAGARSVPDRADSWQCQRKECGGWWNKAKDRCSSCCLPKCSAVNPPLAERFFSGSSPTTRTEAKGQARTGRRLARAAKAAPVPSDTDEDTERAKVESNRTTTQPAPKTNGEHETEKRKQVGDLDSYKDVADKAKLLQHAFAGILAGLAEEQCPLPPRSVTVRETAGKACRQASAGKDSKERLAEINKKLTFLRSHLSLFLAQGEQDGAAEYQDLIAKMTAERQKVAGKAPSTALEVEALQEARTRFSREAQERRDIEKSGAKKAEVHAGVRSEEIAMMQQELDLLREGFVAEHLRKAKEHAARAEEPAKFDTAVLQEIDACILAAKNREDGEDAMVDAPVDDDLATNVRTECDEVTAKDEALRTAAATEQAKFLTAFNRAAPPISRGQLSNTDFSDPALAAIGAGIGMAIDNWTFSGQPAATWGNLQTAVPEEADVLDFARKLFGNAWQAWYPDEAEQPGPTDALPKAFICQLVVIITQAKLTFSEEVTKAAKVRADVCGDSMQVTNKRFRTAA